MPRLTILERGQGHGFTPFLLSTRSVGPRVALRHAACCRVSPSDPHPTARDAHHAQAHTPPRAPTVGRPDAQTALCPGCARSRASPSATPGATRAPAPAPPPPPHGGHLQALLSP